MSAGTTHSRSNRSRFKLVLVSILALGAIASVTVRGVWALYSGQTQNAGSISSGTLTLDNTNAVGGTASTTLSANVGTTTLNGAISAAATSITVSGNASFPAGGSITIIVDNEEMTVTAGLGTNSWTVTRGANGTQAASHANGASVYQASIGVNSATGFPTSGDYTIHVATEEMMVTGGQGTTTWTVTRGVDGTSVANHASGAYVDTATSTTLNGAINASTTSVTVASGAGFANGDTVLVDSEQMEITAGGGTTSWTVARGVNGTTAASHSSGAEAATAACQTINGTSNVNSSCDSLLTFSPAAVAAQTTLNGAITNSATSITVTNGTGFANGQIVVIDAEAMTIVSGGGTTSWTVTRAVDGTTAASHSNNAYVSHQTLGEAYPGMPVTTTVRIKDSGSIAVHDLAVYMPNCLRGITPDAPFAASTPTAASFGTPTTNTGHLAGGTPYYYEVTAVVAGTESVAGAEATYTPPLGTNTNSIVLTWPAVTGATSYKVYRSTTEGGEALLASGLGSPTYTDNTNTAPSGSPPSGTGSGNPCQTGNGGLYVQETDSSGNATACWYPNTGTTCTFDGTIDLGVFASNFNSVGIGSLDLGSGPAALSTRYFTIGLELPSAAGNSLQGVEALFALHWYAQQS